ncbi:MAG: hypothetical protein NTX27_14750, partial [Verrucomicrobia bacterium]|nr:hypothetical protein [Verrucomicrobiota bacterium]
YHPFEPSAQPRWGCLRLWPLPGVAPRRRNPGLHGRIPLGFPEGDGARHDLGDSQRENVDRPSSGVSGWGNWSTPIYAPPIHVHSRFPAPNANGVVPYSPGLRRQRRYPGYGDDDPTNHKVVVPRDRTGGIPLPY